MEGVIFDIFDFFHPRNQFIMTAPILWLFSRKGQKPFPLGFSVKSGHYHFFMTPSPFYGLFLWSVNSPAYSTLPTINHGRVCEQPKKVWGFLVALHINIPKELQKERINLYKIAATKLKSNSLKSITVGCRIKTLLIPRWENRD